ncbi:2-amino-4-hydroxy-6-hydroxymethyldihydropteridine diphosphokinase [Vogesella sp. DC21W]|uniref:2-amino-4-hydroxy-6-hydroxymethyldihydropteridine pyrophosphokinase n=1 Tax=Vogesella aquatica TaxID=2984206 RepID=A0ABT5J133_9NEIS|nr:2-amino-4-hydroxy-6-hydroxymethyldihydropteridine diphosphokinase [Vogesella aquatica]MDC7718538.1 2-amino-4-hydroxy-6-hydroxymethyldihydropteridine diphosphokinase [Vogesella aquatica]
MSRAVIALGSNLENPVQQVEAALAAIAALPGVALLRRSSCYQTAPVGYADQPDFINAVCEVETTLAPQALLAALLEVEQTFGRVRTFRNAPRVLDLDLLLVEGVVLDTAFLTLPHPRMHQRAFVMLPLAEMAADMQVGAHGAAADIAAGLDPAGVKRLA